VGPPKSLTPPLLQQPNPQSEVVQPEVVPSVQVVQPEMVPSAPFAQGPSSDPVEPFTPSTRSSPSSSDRFFGGEEQDSDTTHEESTPSSHTSISGLTPSSVMFSTPSSSVNTCLRASRAEPRHGMVHGVGRGGEKYSAYFLIFTFQVSFYFLTPCMFLVFPRTRPAAQMETSQAQATRKFHRNAPSLFQKVNVEVE
jgi:hypothetical protein